MVLPQCAEHKPNDIQSGHSFTCQNITSLLLKCTAIKKPQSPFKHTGWSNPLTTSIFIFFLAANSKVSFPMIIELWNCFLSHWKSPVVWHIDHHPVCIQEEDKYWLEKEPPSKSNAHKDARPPHTYPCPEKYRYQCMLYVVFHIVAALCRWALWYLLAEVDQMYPTQ